jgi:hypothetical protein
VIEPFWPAGAFAPPSRTSPRRSSSRPQEFCAFLSIQQVSVRRESGVRSWVSKKRINTITHRGGTKMLRPFVVCGLLLTFSLASYSGGEPPAKLPAPPTNAGLEKMKKLAGTWLVGDQEGKPTDQVASIIKVTAGGSVVHETLFPGQPQEMVSIYTVDGPDLIMTHYCVLGNQPRMKADPNSSANQIVFQFSGGGNLDPAKDKHMHAATLTIVDDDHIEVKGTGWENGAPAKDMCCGLKLVRKK